MNKLEKMFNSVKDTLKYLPLAATALLAQELKGQDIRRRSYPLPTEPINLFLTDGCTPLELSYDALTNKTARDAIMPGKVTSDITSKVQGLVCNKSTVLYTLNSKNLG